MPSKSKKQQNFFRLVKAVQNGDVKKKDVSKSVVDAAKGMTKKQVSDFADHLSTKKKKKANESYIMSFEEFNEKLNINPITLTDLDKTRPTVAPFYLLCIDFSKAEQTFIEMFDEHINPMFSIFHQIGMNKDLEFLLIDFTDMNYIRENATAAQLACIQYMWRLVKPTKIDTIEKDVKNATDMTDIENLSYLN